MSDHKDSLFKFLYTVFTRDGSCAVRDRSVERSGDRAATERQRIGWSAHTPFKYSFDHSFQVAFEYSFEYPFDESFGYSIDCLLDYAFDCAFDYHYPTDSFQYLFDYSID